MNKLDKFEQCDAISVVIRDNSGSDTIIDVASTVEASSVVKAHATPSNHMIYVLVDGDRVDRWDRDRVKNENRWVRTNPDEFEVLGQIREVIRG